MFGADKGSTGPLDGKNLHIGVVQARFNEGITNALWDACRTELLALGGWQLQRADEKSALLASQEARRQAPAQPIGELERSADPAFQRVLLRGYFDAEHSLLLDNRTRDGRVGVELLQPFYDQPSGLWLLLNRGWLPWPDRRPT